MATTSSGSARVVLGAGVIERAPEAGSQSVKDRIAALRTHVGTTDGNCTHTGWGD